MLNAATAPLRMTQVATRAGAQKTQNVPESLTILFPLRETTDRL
jgi:hypothetical protein